MPAPTYRTKLIETYREMREPDLFLSAQFEVRPGNITDAKEIEIDIKRHGEEISPVLIDLSQGPTHNSTTQFTTKKWEPPTIDEAVPFNAAELMHRQAGTNAYDAERVDFQAQLVADMLEGMGMIDAKMQRNREWQASQILQTGILTLVDSDGNPVYQIDFKPKTAHFPTAGTAWDAGGANPLDDIEALSDLIRENGKRDADMLIMGDQTGRVFLDNPFVQAALDNRRIDLGMIRPELRDSGGKFWGMIHIGAYQYEIWTYNGRGVIPGDVASTKFVSPTSCIVRASSGRLDTCFGGVPIPQKTDERFRGLLPSTVAVPGAMAVSPNIYTDQTGRQTTLELMSRPLLIPTAIDSFGNINTGVS